MRKSMSEEDCTFIIEPQSRTSSYIKTDCDCKNWLPSKFCGFATKNKCKGGFFADSKLLIGVNVSVNGC